MTVESLLEAHSAQRAALTDRITAMLLTHWRTLASWDRADVSRFIARAVPAVSAGQQLTGRLADVYIAQVLSELLGERVTSTGIAASDLTNLRGVPATEVYSRPFVEVWSALKRGEPFAAGLSLAEDRLRRLVEDDLSLAYRRGAMLAMNRQPGVTGYRRVIRPELARTGGTCGLCIAASGQRYKRSDLMPLHTRCNCGVMPITKDRDPGRDINGQDIDGLYAKALKDTGSDTSARALSATRFDVRTHGELGPVLTPAGQHFAGPASIPAQAPAA